MKFDYLVGHGSLYDGTREYLLKVSRRRKLHDKTFLVGKEEWKFVSRSTTPYEKVRPKRREIWLSARSLGNTRPCTASKERLEEILSAAKTFVDNYKTEKELLREALSRYQSLGTYEELKKIAVYKETPGLPP